MSFYRPAQMAAALCFGVTLALVEWWEILGPIWREVDRFRRTLVGRRFRNARRLRDARRSGRRSLWCVRDAAHTEKYAERSIFRFA